LIQRISILIEFWFNRVTTQRSNSLKKVRINWLNLVFFVIRLFIFRLTWRKLAWRLLYHGCSSIDHLSAN